MACSLFKLQAIALGIDCINTVFTGHRLFLKNGYGNSTVQGSPLTVMCSSMKYS